VNRLLGYAWASPNTAVGIFLGGLGMLLGAGARIVEGAIEFSGGRLGALLASSAIGCPFRAVTLGHVILGTDAATLDCARSHEQVHVRQYERWGPFFLPAYLLSSLWQLACGRRCYRDNWFERQAYEQA
jgi:hypothetical protein